MAPEAPGNLIVLDLSFRGDDLVAGIEQVVPPVNRRARGHLRVRFHEQPESGFVRFGRGVAYALYPRTFTRSISKKPEPIPPVEKAQIRYAWPNAAYGEGLMLILILPVGYTLALENTQPLPRSAKEFQGQLAVYFKPAQGLGDSVTVAWKLKTFYGDLELEAERIRRVILENGTQDNNGSVVDVPGVPPQEQPLSGRAYAIIALMGLLLAIGFTVFYVHAGPQLAQSATQGQLFYLVLVPWALSAAAFLFGAMGSFARLTYRHLDTFLELGGPTVLFCLVIVGGFKLVPSSQETFPMIIHVRSADGRNSIITYGKIFVDLDYRRAATIDGNGEAELKGVPARFRNAKVKVLPQVDGYEENSQELKSNDGILDLALVRAPPPVTVLTGSINPIPPRGASVKILVDGQKGETSPDEFGRFELSVNGRAGDSIRLKVFVSRKLVYDEYQTLPGPVTVALPH